MTITQINCDIERAYIARTILESLPDWFGIPEATEEYIAGSKGRPFFCAYQEEKPVGFLYLKETGKHTVELAAMAFCKSTTELAWEKPFSVRQRKKQNARGTHLSG